MKIEKECFIWYEGPLPARRDELLAGPLKALRFKPKSKERPRPMVAKLTVRVVDEKTKKTAELATTIGVGDEKGPKTRSDAAGLAAKLKPIRGAGTATVCLIAPSDGGKEAEPISNVLTLPVVLGQ